MDGLFSKTIFYSPPVYQCNHDLSAVLQMIAPITVMEFAMLMQALRIQMRKTATISSLSEGSFQNAPLRNSTASIMAKKESLLQHLGPPLFAIENKLFAVVRLLNRHPSFSSSPPYLLLKE